MRAGALLLAVCALQCAQVPARAADEMVHLELNAIETAENRCRLTFVIENKSPQNLDSLKLDFAMFNTDGAVYRRIIFDMAPVRAAKTIVKTYAIDGDCAQLGALLINDVTACVPGEPAACLDGLVLSSRVKNVRLYK
ncbi:MAG: hypothetical protein ACXWJ8_07455 [Xanthobacteraceae bacterium]